MQDQVCFRWCRARGLRADVLMNRIKSSPPCRLARGGICTYKECNIKNGCFASYTSPPAAQEPPLKGKPKTHTQCAVFCTPVVILRVSRKKPEWISENARSVFGGLFAQNFYRHNVTRTPSPTGCSRQGWRYLQRFTTQRQRRTNCTPLFPVLFLFYRHAPKHFNRGSSKNRNK